MKIFALSVFIVLRSSFLLSSHIEKTPLPYHFIQISNIPEVYECEHFLSEEECDAVIEAARPSLKRSTVVDPKSSSGIVDYRRTSLGTFLSPKNEIPAVKKIRNQAYELTKIPKKNGEDLQVLYYPIGGEYQPHFDYFTKNSVHCQRDGQRVATLLVYLNTPIQGGETIFPKAKIRIQPVKGKAILFYNVDLQGRPDPNSFHGGSPVILGEKWVATLWIRESKFQ